LGFADEVWWSRFAYPTLHTWSERGSPERLHQQTRAKDDPDPKALACYGLLIRRAAMAHDQMLIRFVDGRPVSAITTQFLAWACQQLAQQGVTALLLIWDNASWHKSKAVRTWIRDHNQQVKLQNSGVRILPFLLPVKSPWLNPIEPKWVHGKRAIIEPNGTLTAQALADRVCDYFDCSHEPHLSISE
jgi:transposase